MKVNGKHNDDWRLGDVLFDKYSSTYYLIVACLKGDEANIGLATLKSGICIVNDSPISDCRTFEDIVRLTLKNHYGDENLVKVNNAYLNVEGN